MAQENRGISDLNGVPGEHAGDARQPGPEQKRIGSPAHRPVENRTDARAAKELPRGFTLQNPETPRKVRELSRRSSVLMIAFAFIYWANIGLAAAATEIAAHFLGLAVAAAIFLVAIMWIARSMRALECMVHEFGHGVFTKNRFVNDLVGNMLVALPMFTTIAAMRESHNDPHHKNLGMRGIDPDLRRYDQMDAHDLDRSNARSFARDVAVRLPSYVIGWSRLTTGSSTVLIAFLWHAALVWLPLYMFYGDVAAALARVVLFWIVPQLVMLSVIRFIGETGKHVYSGGLSIAAVTVSNIGPMHKLLIHPFGDGHHTLHHIRADVPGYNLGRLHRWLMANEPGYRKALRYRLRILERPRSGSPE